jgi:hypothetical protein
VPELEEPLLEELLPELDEPLPEELPPDPEELLPEELLPELDEPLPEELLPDPEELLPDELLAPAELSDPASASVEAPVEPHAVAHTRTQMNPHRSMDCMVASSRPRMQRTCRPRLADLSDEAGVGRLARLARGPGDG